MATWQPYWIFWFRGHVVSGSGQKCTDLHNGRLAAILDFFGFRPLDLIYL